MWSSSHWTKENATEWRTIKQMSPYVGCIVYCQCIWPYRHLMFCVHDREAPALNSNLAHTTRRHLPWSLTIIVWTASGPGILWAKLNRFTNARNVKCLITLFHFDCKLRNDMSLRSSDPPSESVSSNAAAGPSSKSILMTCHVVVHAPDAPDGSTAEARALLDSGSTASFVSERLSQSLSPIIAPSFMASLISLIAHQFKRLPVSLFRQYMIPQGNSVWRLSLYQRSHVTCLSIQFGVTSNWSTWLAYAWPIHTLVILERSISS